MKIEAINASGILPAWFEWRVSKPFRFINNAGQHYAYVTKKDIGDYIAPDVNVLVLPRVIVGRPNRAEAEKWFNSIKNNGTTLVYESDDDIWSESYVSNQIGAIQFDFDKESFNSETLSVFVDIMEENRADALWTLQQCNGATVSTKALQTYLIKIGGIPVVCVENAIDVDGFVSSLSNEKYDCLTVGWAGGRRNPDDLNEMIEAWIKLAERVDINFVVAGWKPPQLEKENCKALFDRIKYIPWDNIHTYGRGMQVDVGCCAVAPTDFNSRKSLIKTWEFALAGAVVVGSDFLYKDEPFIFPCKSVGDWVAVIKYLLKDASTRKLMNSIGVQHVKDYHDLKYNHYRWTDAYEWIMDNGRQEVVV
jgi:glycosyltransferase involved in cell wall biosynthesis